MLDDAGDAQLLFNPFPFPGFSLLLLDELGGMSERDQKALLKSVASQGSRVWVPGELSRSEAGGQLRYFVDRDARHALILAGDHLYRMDYRDLLADLMLHDADVAIGVMPCSAEQIAAFGAARVDDDGRIAV